MFAHEHLGSANITQSAVFFSANNEYAQPILSHRIFLVRNGVPLSWPLSFLPRLTATS
jgi:hypothetical protein